MSKAAQLIALADEIINSSESDKEVLLDKFDRYAEIFDAWFSGHQKLLSSPEGQSGIDLLRQVQERHTAVLAKAAEFKEELTSQMRQLKRKSKGILAYSGAFLPPAGAMSRKKW